ncbi:zinc ribbon domain-containing protein [Staphylococcus cohnii]|uniref:zinc ribbon domain-containing protein n=1 Tax=Staphylococcus cohnii TaxID=29382 RepID=UPI0028CB997C|nr:zinc ribbon domain-containing protein [Staphylococcus cohnii]
MFQMKYCSNCGAEIKPGQRVCTQCGRLCNKEQIINHLTINQNGFYLLLLQ